jgi:hypothetical protein
MNDLQHQLTQNVASSVDRFDSFMASADPTSLEDLRAITPAYLEVVLAQWAASLDTKTRHDLLKSGIDAIK